MSAWFRYITFGTWGNLYTTKLKTLWNETPKEIWRDEIESATKANTRQNWTSEIEHSTKLYSDEIERDETAQCKKFAKFNAAHIGLLSTT